MIHRIHRPPTKATSRTAYLDYCLRSTGRSVNPVILAGDPVIMRDLLNKSNFRESCTGGCLAFGEIIPNRKMLKEIISSYEDYCLAGLNPDDVQRIWILHEDKAKTELHFVFANLHLTTGKKYSHYAVQTGDWGAIDAWQFIVNEKYNLRNPLDEKYKRLDAQPIANLPKRKSEIKNKIDQLITSQIIAGRIRDRNDIILFLENSGFEVKQTRTGISIREIGSAEKFLRLKGGKYEHGWTGPTHKKPAGKGDRDDPDSGRRRYKVKSLPEYERILADSTTKRAARQSKIHGSMCARTKLFSVQHDSVVQGMPEPGTNAGTDITGSKHTDRTRNPNDAGLTRASEKGESKAQETLESEISRIIPNQLGGNDDGGGNYDDGNKPRTTDSESGTADSKSKRVHQLIGSCAAKSKSLCDALQRNAHEIALTLTDLENFSNAQREGLKEPKEEPVKTNRSLEVEPHKFTVREFRQTFRKKTGYCVIDFRNGLAWVVQWFEEMPPVSDAQGKFLEAEGRLFKSVSGKWVELQKGKSSVKGRDK